MPGKNESVAGESAASNPMGGNASVDQDRFDRLAQLIADGEVSFPKDLNADEEARLLKVVRERMRRRLISYIAKRVAHEIHVIHGATRSGKNDQVDV
jgi:hypothetical protein